jgi:hypothetical protein
MTTPAKPTLINKTDLTPEIVAALKSAHGPCLTKVTSKDGEAFVVVRPPTGAEYRYTMDKQAEGEKEKVIALEQLGRDVAVFPPGTEVAEIWARKPGLAMLAGDEALEMSGLGKVETEKL